MGERYLSIDDLFFNRILKVLAEPWRDNVEAERRLPEGWVVLS